MKNRKLNSIKYIMLFTNILAVFLVVSFIYITTQKICENYIAREFIETVEKVPKSPYVMLLLALCLLIILLGSFFLREFWERQHIILEYGLLIFEFMISMCIIVVLDFNYNGIILWVFANAVSHITNSKGRYLLIFVAVISLLGTDYELISINRNLVSITDYIYYYQANVQQYLLGAFNLLISLNLVIFIIYCIFVIQDQRGIIEEVNFLYSKLSSVNGELQNANVRLQKYAVMKEKMGETKERNRLAREIHDTLGHTLTGLAAGIDACIATIDYSKSATKQQLERLAGVSREGIGEIRRSVNELRPDALERLNLEYAIHKMIGGLTAVTNTEIFFECKVEALKFDEDEENAIYRVIQESITNAIRHGRAEKIWITIEKEESDIHLKIKDNGVGCEVIKSGFGSQHIIERIEMLQGHVTFHGGNGFTVDAMIPIRWGEEYD